MPFNPLLLKIVFRTIFLVISIFFRYANEFSRKQRSLIFNYFSIFLY